MTLLDTTIDVRYGYLTLHDGFPGELEDAFRGQLNGVCGAALPGQLHVRTGRHTGPVRVTVTLHADEPPLDEAWEEAVEVWFATAAASGLVVSAYEGTTGIVPLPPGNYRVRLCAAGMDTGRDHYLFQCWPATGTDRVVRRHAATATVLHELRMPPLSPAELADRVRQVPPAEAAWLPSADVEVGLGALAEAHPPLVSALAGLSQTTQREVAAWAALRALETAEMASLPWVDRAIEAVRHGTRLVVGDVATPDESPELAGRQQRALATLFDAALPDPLTAASRAIWAAAQTRGPDPTWVYAALRTAFPTLLSPWR